MLLGPLRPLGAEANERMAESALGAVHRAIADYRATEGRLPPVWTGADLPEAGSHEPPPNPFTAGGSPMQAVPPGQHGAGNYTYLPLAGPTVNGRPSEAGYVLVLYGAAPRRRALQPAFDSSGFAAVRWEYVRAVHVQTGGTTVINTP